MECLLLAVNDPARSGQKKSAPFDYVALFQLMKLNDFGRDSDIILTLLMLNIQKKKLKITWCLRCRIRTKKLLTPFLLFT